MIQAMIRGVTSDQRSRSRWATFAGWHRTEQLWREIYTRAVSALIAALVIYLVAAASGVVTRKPLPWLSLAGACFAVVAGMREWRLASHPRRRDPVPDRFHQFTASILLACAVTLVLFAVAYWVFR